MYRSHALKVAVSALVLTLGHLALAFLAPTPPRLPDYDKRTLLPGAPAALPAEQTAAVAELRTRVANLNVDFDPVSGAPKLVQAADGFLSVPDGQGGPAAPAFLAALPPDDPYRATRAFLQANRRLFGHGPEVLDQARIAREFVTPHSGLRTVVWEQQVAGLPVFEAVLISHTTRRGELVNIGSQFIAAPARAADRGTPNRAALVVAPVISARQALVLAAQNAGDALSAEAVVAAGAAAADAEQRQKFTAPGLKGEAEAKLLWLPTDKDTLRLCWDVLLVSRSRGEMFRVLVEVSTGEVLLRRCLTHYLTDASYMVYTSDSPSPLSPGPATPGSSQPPLRARTLVTWPALDTNASPLGWIGEGGNETLGNNVDAHTDWNDDDLQDLPRPQGSPFRVFNFPMTLASQDPTNYAAAAVVQLFYLCNWMHDRLYELGFNEAAGNFQSNNLGRGGLGHDALQADAQDGSGTDNANMSTPPDGSAPRMQMYIFTGPSPRRDGDLDAEVVLHEYTHGLSDRRVGGGVGLSALQSGGMGEGWSDFYALALLSAAGDNVNGNYAAGAYASYRLGGANDLQNYYYGIRRYPYTTDLSKNPLTFKDIDPAQADDCASGAPFHTALFGTCSAVIAAEVHNQGEVWCVTLWEARANLINNHGWVVGNQLILQLVTDGMNLAPPNPTFVQARDAILQADLVATGGANRRELWAAFAKRGLGFSATSPASTTTTGVQEAYDLPDDLRVSPASGFAAAGPVGGPFDVSSQTNWLSNVGSNTLSWTLASTAAWLSVSATSGSLAPGGAATPITVSLNAHASALPLGRYSATLFITNLADGAVQSRTFSLMVGQPDYYAEWFDATTNDLAFSTLTFTPNGSPDFYAACREAATSFPTDPAGGTRVSLADDEYARVTLTGTNTVSLYGRRTNVFYIGSNGYLTLGAGDDTVSESWTHHFALPRIAALFHDLNPATGGTVSWQQSAGHVAVTYQGVPEYGATTTNDFQIELFADGRLRLTYLTLNCRNNLVGLSAGQGVPVGFKPSDLSASVSCLPPLTLLLPATATEGEGTLVGAGRVRLPLRLATNLVVSLAASDPTEVTVPASVTIPAGQTNVAFNLTIVDDVLLDGTQSATLTAAAPGFVTARATLAVNDSETASLQVRLPATVLEGAGDTLGVVRVSAPVGRNVPVTLVSSDPAVVQVPASVIIPTGQTSAVFTASIPASPLIHGPASASVIAHVPNWTHGEVTVTVLDNKALNLQVGLPAYATEGDGVLLNAGQVQLAGTLPTNLVVSLSSSKLTALQLPPSVTIPAGQSLATFDLAILHNPQVTGDQDVGLAASAPGFVAGSAAMIVRDYETPRVPSNPLPGDLAANVSAATALSWTGGTGDVTNDVYFGTHPVPGAAELVGSTTAAAWTLPLLAPSTTYFWQLVSRRVGVTSGPVWRFTTRGVDRFSWDAIASAQLMDRAFSVRLTALDELGRPVVGFAGPVTLAGVQGLPGTVQFRDDFEDGESSDWNNNGGSYVRAATNDTAARGLASLTLIGGASRHFDGVAHALGNLTPSRVTFHTRASTTNAAGGYFVLGNGTNNSSAAAFFYFSRANGMGLVEDVGGPHLVPYVANQWYKITLLFNWTAKSVDFYVDDVLAYAGIPFRGAAIDSLTGIWLYNYDHTQAWWDEIELTTGSLSAPVSLTPTNADNFVEGVWTGNVTVLELADTLYLSAEDRLGHNGKSPNFTVRAQNDVRLTLDSSPRVVATGQPWTNTITVANAGPDLATGVQVAQGLPAGVNLVSALASQGAFTVSHNSVLFDAGALAAGGQAGFSVVLTATGAGTFTNLAAVTCHATDPVPANNTAQTTTLVLPTLAIDDTAVAEGDLGNTAALFTVRLSAPSTATVRVSFTTSNGTASAGADYLNTSGTLVFNPGVITQQAAVPVLGNTQAQPDRTFYVQLLSPVNAVLDRSQGRGRIVDNDNTPGKIHHFVWSPVVSPQGMGTAFPVTLTAVDAFGMLATNFNATATLGSLAAGPGEVFRADFAPGLQGFTLDNTNSQGLWHLSSGRALDSGHSANTSLYYGHNEGPGGGGNYDTGLRNGGAALSPAISLPAAGAPFTLAYNYLMGVEFATNWDQAWVDISTNNGASFQTVAGKNTPGGPTNDTGGLWASTIVSLPPLAGPTLRLRFRFDTADASANNAEGWYLDDLVVRSGAGGSSVVVGPALIGPFTNGVWSGSLVVSNAATGLVLVADDGNGHVGTNSPFEVRLNDLRLAVTGAPDPATVGSELTYTLTVANNGPGDATGVVVTNFLPAGLHFVSAACSQGTWLQKGNLVIGNLGTLAGAAGAWLTILATPTAAGLIKNVATVARNEADAIPANNLAAVVTRVSWPPTATNFGAPGPLAIPGIGPAAPYPSSNLVAGLTGTLAKVTVTIGNLTHSWPGDLSLLLAGPAGQSVLLMGATGAGYGITNVTLTFDDEAGRKLPQAGPIVSGVFQPTSYDPGTLLPPPAPAPAYADQLSAFHGSNPNGPWRLFVTDNSSGDAGSINDGWSLTLITVPLPRLVLQPPVLVAGQFRFSFATVPGYSYVAEYKQALTDGAWLPLQTLPGDGTVQTVTDTNTTEAQRFYRVRMQ